MMSPFRTSLRNLLAIGLLLAVSGQAQADFSARAVYRNASPSVVVIYGLDASGNGSSGTGSIITPDGKILTNNHVIFDANRNAPYEHLVVFFKPAKVTGDLAVDLKTQYRVKILGRDPSMDLAVLQVIDPPPNLRPIALSNSETVEIGSSVAAIGHPGGGGLWTLTTGTISSTRKDGSRDVFQTDTAINPGNSGGPLLDENAHLIGVNTFVRRVNDAGLPLEGLNYSLRSSMARTWLAQHQVQVAFAPAVPAASPYSEPAPRAPEPRYEKEPRYEAPEAAQTTAPRHEAPAEFEPPPPTPQPGSSRPRPQVSIDPEVGPAPRHAPDPFGDEPRKSGDEPRKSGNEPREFVGPNGEDMFGVPTPDFSLDAARSEVYRKTLKNAEGAFDELDSW